MKTITTTVYEFSELTEQAKENAINTYRQQERGDYQFIYDDAYESVKQFHNIFGTKSGRNSWLEIDFSHIDEDILNLSGFRLQKYIWNNYKNDLFKGKYYSVSSNKKVYHKRVISKDCKNGNIFNAYYSAITLTNSCVLTGVCYDDDLLNNIYDFLNSRSPEHTDFKDLLEDSIENLRISIENEVDAMNENDYIIDYFESNDINFDEQGNIV